jgi:aryl-alcohol dehydrogenase-like predicted oxidoreductase
MAALGRPGYITLGHAHDLPSTDARAMEAHAHRVLDAAWDAGVRWFDVARSYGRAEEFLASWLAARAIAPGAATISSKWGYTYTAAWQVHAERHEVKDHSAAKLDAQLAETRALLGAHLSLYQVHSATLESGVLDDAAVHARLRALRDAGVRVGLTTSGAAQAETLRRAIALDLFDAAQVTLNVLERSIEPVLADAKRAGMRVIAKEALANGRLTARAPALPAALAERARAAGVGADAAAIAWVLARPHVDVVLSGAATVEQLRSNLDALALAPTLTPTPDALDTLAEPPAAYWATRSRLAWN